MDVLGLTWQSDSLTAPSCFLPLPSQVLIPRTLPSITPAREPITEPASWGPYLRHGRARHSSACATSPCPFTPLSSTAPMTGMHTKVKELACGHKASSRWTSLMSRASRAPEPAVLGSLTSGAQSPMREKDADAWPLLSAEAGENSAELGRKGMSVNTPR